MSSTKLEIDESIYQNQLLIKDKEDEIDLLMPSEAKAQVPSAIIKPEPGLCVKTKEVSSSAKVFVNVCTSESVPAPEDISTEQLLDIFESDDPSDYRVPMSIGSPHDEKDKGGNACVAYDVVINPSFLDKIKDNPLFSTFFMVVTIEGLDQKYGISLDKNSWTVLKNKKYMGQLPSDQKIRTALPLIQELSGVKDWKPKDFQTTKENKPKIEVIKAEDSGLIEKSHRENLISEVKTTRKPESGENDRKKSPSFTLEKKMASPPFSSPFLQIEVDLPSVIFASEVKFEIGTDRILVESKSHFLDENFPYEFDVSQAKAFFIKLKRVLVLFIPLKT